MGKYKISLEDLEIDYNLIGINSSLESFRLAYFLNKFLRLNLRKNKQEIELISKTGKSNFINYTYEDNLNDITWNLIENQSYHTISKEENFGIFKNINTTTFIIPEFNKINYFIKIDNLESHLLLENTIKKIQNIPNINMCFEIETELLKSKNNLIF